MSQEHPPLHSAVMSPPAAPTPVPPGAALEPERPLPRALPATRGGWLWLIPAATLFFALWVGWQAWRNRGVEVTISFAQGHGILAGDAVKFRGIAVGDVRDVGLGPDAASVILRVSLRPEAAELAREGTRFWLVRPELGLQRVSGLDTIIGARYVALWPGDGAPARHFVGLDDEPVVDVRSPGDLQIVIEAPRRGSLSPGSPLNFRQVQIGAVESIALSRDGTMVEIRVLVLSPFAHLVRDNSVFWDTGGIEVGFGLKGLTAAVESPAALLRGGLSVATPNAPGPAVVEGSRFLLAERFDDDWLKWRPALE